MANLNSNALTQFHAQLTEEFNVPELQQFVQDMEDAEKMQKVFESSKHLHKLNNVEEFSNIFKKKNENSTSTSDSSDGNYCSEGYKFNPQSGLCEPTEESLADFPSLEAVKPSSTPPSPVEEIKEEVSVEADFTKIDYTDADSVRNFAMFMEDKFINPTDGVRVDENSFQAADDIEIVEDQYKKAQQEAEGGDFQNTEMYSPNQDEIKVKEGSVGVNESEENWLGSLLFGGEDIGLLYTTGENRGKALSKEDRVKYLAQKKLDVINAKKDEVLLKVMDSASRDAANASPWDAEIYSNVVPQDVTSGLFIPTNEDVEYNINDYNNQTAENNNIIADEFWGIEGVRIQDLITKNQTEEYTNILQGILKKYQDKYGEALSNALPQDREAIQLELTEELQSVRDGLHEKYSLLYQEEIDKSEKQLIKELKPSTSLLTNTEYSAVDKKLDSIGFGNSNAQDKKYALDNAWYGIKEGLVQSGMNPEEISKRQNEFYYYYYDKIAIDSKGMPTTFAVKDWADDLLSELNTYKSEKIEILSADFMDGSDSKEALNDYNKDKKSIAVVEKYLNDIIESPEKMADSGFKNFMRGLTSLHGYEYIPFISGIAHLDDNINLYNIAKKKQSGEELTPAENILLTSQSLKQMTDENVSNLSTGYNAGKLTGNMIPYVGEFIMTSGAFTVGKKATRKVLDKYLLRHIDNVVTEAGELTVKARAVDGVSWVAGTIAQTAVNPQHYIAETFKNMTPEVALALTSEGDEFIESLDADLSLMGKFEGGSDDFSTAFLKGFGVTWAEFATERMGEMIPMAGKHIKTKWLNDPEWMKRLMLGRYLRHKGWGKAEAVRHFTKDKMSWNGLLGEIFEETINQPLSNIIQGNTWNEGMDEDFFKELGISMGATQAVFGGLQLGANIITPQASYIMNGDRYESFKEMQDAMQELKSSGKLAEKDFELNLQIDNDENAFNAAAAFMSQFNRESDVSFKGEQDIADKTSVVKGIIKKVFGGNVDFIEVGGKSEMIETMEKQAAEARNNGNADLGLEAEIKRLQSDEFANTEGFFRGVDGKIYLNTKIATPELIFHESTHKATVKLKEMLGDKYYSKILDVIEKDPRIKKQLSWAITNYYEGKGTTKERETVLDEAFTEYIAQMAKKKFDAKDSTMRKILEWLRDMLFEANEAGHNTADVENFISIAEHISTSMAEGSQINIEKDPEGGYSKVNTSFKKANLYKKGDVLIDNVWKKELEFDSNNDVVLYHFSAADKLEGNKLDPKFFGKMAWTEKDAANWGRKRINFHTSPENKEKYYGGTPYIVKMPLDKIYPSQQDPLGFVKKYKADKGMPIDKTLPPSIQLDIIAESIKDYGFKAMMSSWDNKFRVDMFEPVQPVNLNRKETTHDWSESRAALPQTLKDKKKDAKQLSYNGLMLEEVEWSGVDKGYKPASQWHVKTTNKISLNSDYKIQRETAPQVTPSGTKTAEVIKVVASPYKVTVKEEYVYDSKTKSHKAVDRVVKQNTNDYQTIGFFNSVEEAERFITEKEGYEYVKFKKGDKIKALAKTSLISHWVDLIRENYGFTWHWKTGNMATNSLENKDLYPDGNWSVSLHPDYSLKNVDPANISAVKEWLAQSESVIESSDYSVGGWINEEGLLYLDIVTLVHEKDLAHNLGSKYNQEGVFDLADGTDAAYSETGGTGESTPEIEAINPHERHLDVVYTQIEKTSFKKSNIIPIDINSIAEIEMTKEGHWNLLGITSESKEEWRKKNIKGTIPSARLVSEAAIDLENGDITQSEYIQVVRDVMPIHAFKEVPSIPTPIEVAMALDKSKIKAGIIGVTTKLNEGEIFRFRLNIPSYRDYGVWVVTAHENTSSQKAIAYGQTATIKNVTFLTSPKASLKIAKTAGIPEVKKVAKSSFAVMKGEYISETVGSAKNRAENAIIDADWIQIGMNPYRHSWFYDKANGNPVRFAEEVIQVGALVMARGVQYSDITDPQFSVGDGVQFRKVDTAIKGISYKGKDVSEWTPEEFEEFGNMHGVPNLGPLSTLVDVYDETLGRTIQIPNGFEGEFTYYDMMWMKAKGINPSLLSDKTNIELQKKKARSVQPTELNELEVFNRMLFAMLSPNQPLTPNEFEYMALRVRDMEDLEKLAAFATWEPHSITIAGSKDKLDPRVTEADRAMQEHFKTAAAHKGGLGLKSSSNYPAIAEFATLFLQNPDWFKKKESESWFNFVDRLASQVNGLGTKVASFGAVFQDPLHAALSVIDRHMAALYYTEFNQSPKEKAKWESGIISSWKKKIMDGKKWVSSNKKSVKAYSKNKSSVDKKTANKIEANLKLDAYHKLGYHKIKTLDELLDTSGGNAHFGEIFRKDLSAKKSKLMKKDGTFGDNVTEELKKVDWLIKPEQIQVMSDKYRSALKANEENAVNYGLHLFPAQWMEWDIQRRRLEPHEVLFPNLYKLPKMSFDQIKNALIAHRELGYTNSSKQSYHDTRKGGLSQRLKPTKEMNPMQPERMSYFKKSSSAEVINKLNSWGVESLDKPTLELIKGNQELLKKETWIGFQNKNYNPAATQILADAKERRLLSEEFTVESQISGRALSEEMLSIEDRLEELMNEKTALITYNQSELIGIKKEEFNNATKRNQSEIESLQGRMNDIKSEYSQMIQNEDEIREKRSTLESNKGVFDLFNGAVFLLESITSNKRWSIRTMTLNGVRVRWEEHDLRHIETTVLPEIKNVLFPTTRDSQIRLNDLFRLDGEQKVMLKSYLMDIKKGIGELEMSEVFTPNQILIMDFMDNIIKGDIYETRTSWEKVVREGLDAPSYADAIAEFNDEFTLLKSGRRVYTIEKSDLTHVVNHNGDIALFDSDDVHDIGMRLGAKDFSDDKMSDREVEVLDIINAFHMKPFALETEIGWVIPHSNETFSSVVDIRSEKLYGGDKYGVVATNIQGDRVIIENFNNNGDVVAIDMLTEEKSLEVVANIKSSNLLPTDVLLPNGVQSIAHKVVPASSITSIEFEDDSNIDTTTKFKKSDNPFATVGIDITKLFQGQQVKLNADPQYLKGYEGEDAETGSLYNIGENVQEEGVDFDLSIDDIKGKQFESGRIKINNSGNPQYIISDKISKETVDSDYEYKVRVTTREEGWRVELNTSINPDIEHNLVSEINSRADQKLIVAHRNGERIYALDLRADSPISVEEKDMTIKSKLSGSNLIGEVILRGKSHPLYESVSTNSVTDLISDISDIDIPFELENATKFKIDLLTELQNISIVEGGMESNILNSIDESELADILVNESFARGTDNLLNNTVTSILRATQFRKNKTRDFVFKSEQEILKTGQKSWKPKVLIEFLNSPKRAIKKEELDWLGIEEWLEGKDKVSSEQITKFFNGSRMDFREVILGEAQFRQETYISDIHDAIYIARTKLDVDYEVEASKEELHKVAKSVFMRSVTNNGDTSHWLSEQEAEEMWTEYLKHQSKADDTITNYRFTVIKKNDGSIYRDENGSFKLLNRYDAVIELESLNVIDGAPKYSDYKSEIINEDYQEILFYIPENTRDEFYGLNLQNVKHVMVNEVDGSFTIQWRNGDNFVDIIDDNTGMALSFKTKEEADLKVEEFYNIRNKSRVGGGSFKSSHFDDRGRNLLFHMRTMNIKGENGESVLMIEEIQSDLHQKARDKRKEDIKKEMKDIFYNETQKFISNEGSSIPESAFRELNEGSNLYYPHKGMSLEAQQAAKFIRGLANERHPLNNYYHDAKLDGENNIDVLTKNFIEKHPFNIQVVQDFDSIDNEIIQNDVQVDIDSQLNYNELTGDAAAHIINTDFPYADMILAGNYGNLSNKQQLEIHKHWVQVFGIVEYNKYNTSGLNAQNQDSIAYYRSKRRGELVVPWENTKLDTAIQIDKKLSGYVRARFSLSYHDGKLPAAPFKKDWSEFLLKQALAKAVAEGNDAISWTTGAEQVRRYGTLLGTVTDEIRYHKVAEGRYDIIIMKGGRENDVKSSLSESEVRELLGDHMTDIIINDPKMQKQAKMSIANIRFNAVDTNGNVKPFRGEDTKPILQSIKEKRYGDWGVTVDEMIEKHMEEFHPEFYISGPINWGRVVAEDAVFGSIKGDNITIGGRGMQMFYDKMIPSFMNKYTKKWGSKYEFIKPQKNYQYQVKDGEGNIIDLTPSDVFVVELDYYAVNTNKYDWNGQIGEGDIGMYIMATEIDGITRPVRVFKEDVEWDNEMHIEIDEYYGSLNMAIEEADDKAEGSKMGRHQLTITDAMKESFKNNGQTLFKKADRGFTERFEDRPTMTYQPQSWDDMEQAAMEKTDTEIVDGLRFSNLLSHDTASNSSVLDGMFLFQKYDSMSRDKSLSEEERAKAKRQSDELYEKIAVNGTAIAQALSQYGWLKTATPKGMIEMFEKSIGKHGAKITTKQRLMFEELASKDIDTKQDIRTAKEEFLKNPSKSALEALNEAQENHRIAHIKLMNTMQKYTPKNFWKILGTILRGNLLTPASQVLNVVGNLSGAPLRIPTNLVRGFVDMIATGATSALSGVEIERSKLIRAGAIFDNIKGGYMGFFEAVTQMYYGVDPKELGKYDVNTGLQPINALIQLFAKEEMYSNDIKFNQERYNEVLNNFYDQQELEGEDRNESNIPEHVLLEAKMFSEEGSRSVMSVVNKVLESFGLPAEAMFRLLPFGDSPFYRGIYTRVIEEQADILGLKGFEREKFLKFPSAKAKQLADEEASRATFQDENFLKAAMNNIRGSLSTKDAVGGPLDFGITVLFPFTGVPSNIAKQTLEYSMYPLSFAWGMYKLVDSMKLAMKLNGMKEGSSQYNSLKEQVERQKKDGANYIGIATTGMMIFKVGLMLAADGIIGAGDDDKRVRDASYEHLPKHFINISALKRMMLGEDTKMMPNDNKRNVVRIGPLGIILATAADSYNKSEGNDAGRKYLDSLTITDYGLQENTRDSKGADYNVFDMFMNSISAVYEQSFLTSVSAMLDAIADPERNMERFTRNLTKELMSIPLPNTMGQATRANQENMTDITLEYEGLSTKEIIQKSYREKMFWSTDGWMLKRDMFGRAIKRTPQGKNPIIHQMFNPTKEGSVNNDKASWFVYNLAQRTGNSKIIPSVSRNYGNGMKWDKEEWLDYQEQVGGLRLNAVNSIVKNLEESHKKDIFAIMRDESIMNSISWGGRAGYEEEMQTYSEEMMVRDALTEQGILPEGSDPTAPSSGIIDILLKIYSKSDKLIKREVKLNKIKKGTPEFSDDTDWTEIKTDFNSAISDVLINIDFSNE